jgi:anti-sigma-K factor RskA
VAAAIAAVLGVGIGSGLVNDGGGSSTPAGITADGPTVAVLADARGADVARVVATDDGDVMVLERLRELQPGDTYQLWSVDGPRPVSLGLLGDGHDPAVRITLPPATAKLAISQEPAGGSTLPTGPLVASGTLVRPA